VRYADDWLLGFAGPRWEAEAIKSTIGTFLRDELKLELSDSKTLIHATTGAARFPGYEIKAQHADDKLDRRGQRAVSTRADRASFAGPNPPSLSTRDRPRRRGQSASLGSGPCLLRALAVDKELRGPEEAGPALHDQD
jgi:hypothetical protein